VLEDLDLSGRFWQNRQFDAAISMLEAGDSDAIVVWRWSRVARNRLDWAVAVDRVGSVGGRLESATEPFDVTTATGRFARGMLAEFAAGNAAR
jgi:site-specific DNA recombinase